VTESVDSAEAGVPQGAGADQPVPRNSRVRRWSFIAVAAALAILSFYSGRTTSGLRHLPELAATLPGDESGFNRELDARVQQDFPLGSREKKLIDELSRQGFAPEWRERDDANAASFVWTGLLCSKVVRVIWRADEQGLLTQIGGSYASKCAL
jgi:hypothetical protein